MGKGEKILITTTDAVEGRTVVRCHHRIILYQR